MAREIVIFGCGGHARSVADVLLSSDPETKLTFVDENARPDEKIFGFDVIQSVEVSSGKEYFVAIGDNSRRQAIRKSLGSVVLTNIISPTAHIQKDAVLEEGIFIAHGAYVGPLSELGPGSIINTRAQIDHEVRLGSDSQIAPAVVVGGRVVIGDRAFIGIGARIIDGINICPDAVIGASATVVRDIEEPGTYVGTPATKIERA